VPLPNPPSNLTATANSAIQVSLAWSDNSGNEDGFRIERCDTNNCTNFAQIAQVGPNTTTFTNTGLTRNKFYRYRVRAFNLTGNSAYSNIAEVRTPK
jgi:titin